MLKTISVFKIGFTYSSILWGIQVSSGTCIVSVLLLALHTLEPCVFIHFLRDIFFSDLANFLESVLVQTDQTTIGKLRAILEEADRTYPIIKSWADAAVTVEQKAGLNALAADIAETHKQAQVDIDNNPNSESFMNFLDKRERFGNAGKPLPESFPEEFKTTFTSTAYIVAAGTTLIFILSYFFK